MKKICNYFGIDIPTFPEIVLMVITWSLFFVSLLFYLFFVY